MFYNHLGLKPIYKNEGGQTKVDTGREALEWLILYWKAEPIARAFLKYRDVSKMLSMLKAGIDNDNRFRAMYNPAGTESGRFSSSKNPMRTGGNAQNIDPQVRHIFVADQGYKMAYVDLEQAEARAVAYMATEVTGRANYLEACEGGDLHTIVAKLVWTELPWTGDPDEDKEIAKRPYYRHFTYRDLAKRGAHGTSYGGTPNVMAKHLKVPKSVLEDFQERFFAQFPKSRSGTVGSREKFRARAY